MEHDTRQLIPHFNPGVYLQNIMSKTYLIYPKGIYDQGRILLPNIAGFVFSLVDGQKTLLEITEICSKVLSAEPDMLYPKIQSLFLSFEDFISTNYVINKDEQSFDLHTRSENVDSATKDEITRPDYPNEIAFLVTRKCHFKCKYCYMGDSINNETVLALPVWERVIEESCRNACRRVFISGGEPFLVPEIFDYIGIASTNKMSVGVSTKLGLSEIDIKKLIAVGLDTLQVSLDAATPTLNDFLTGQVGSFDGMLKTITYAKEAGQNIHCRTVLTKYNICEIPRLIELLEKLHVNEIRINHYAASCGRLDRDLIPNSEDIDELDEWMKKNSDSYSIKIKYNFGRSHFTGKSPHYFSLTRAKCGGMRDAVVIREDGNIMFCNLLANDDRFIIGNVYDDTVKDVWNSEKAYSFLRPCRETFHNTPCYMCQRFEPCVSKRCYMRSVIRYGTPYERDPWCPYGDYCSEMII